MTNSGLEGVVVADTQISDVDGERGRLVIAGSDVEQLAPVTSFEAAVGLVVAAGSGAPASATITPAAIGAARAAAWELVSRLGDALDHPDGMDALRTALGHLRTTGAAAGDAIAVIGAAPVFVAAWSRRRAGQPAIAPEPSRGHAADDLRMTTGRAPATDAVRALDAYLVTVIDHAMSASTFTARVIASTQSDLISAVVGAVGALKGPLHGGAPGPALDMVFEIGSADRAEPVLREKLARGERLMGFGHRVYRVRDPRADVLAEAAARFYKSGGSGGDIALYELARSVEATALRLLREHKPDRPLDTNVEFYTALLLHGLGLPTELFTPLFAVGRVSGWVAHCLEQLAHGRLIRPQSEYVGERDRRWVPLEARG